MSASGLRGCIGRAHRKITQELAFYMSIASCRAGLIFALFFTLSLPRFLMRIIPLCSPRDAASTTFIPAP